MTAIRRVQGVHTRRTDTPGRRRTEAVGRAEGDQVGGYGADRDGDPVTGDQPGQERRDHGRRPTRSSRSRTCRTFTGVTTGAETGGSGAGGRHVGRAVMAVILGMITRVAPADYRLPWGFRGGAQSSGVLRAMDSPVSAEV